MKAGAKVLISCVILVLSLYPGCRIAADGDPGPNPVQKAVVHLEADGTGDYRTLAEAVAAVPEGGTVALAPGIYQLAIPLLIDKSHWFWKAKEWIRPRSSAVRKAVLWSGEAPASFMPRESVFAMKEKPPQTCFHSDSDKCTSSSVDSRGGLLRNRERSSGPALC